MDTSIKEPYEFYIAIKNKVTNHRSKHVHEPEGPHSDMVRKENSSIM